METPTPQKRPSLLISLALHFSADEPPLLNGWVYRRDLGVWVDADDQESLMVGSAPKPGPTAPKPKPRPISKKHDRETGEDMKGG